MPYGNHNIIEYLESKGTHKNHQIQVHICLYFELQPHQGISEVNNYINIFIGNVNTKIGTGHFDKYIVNTFPCDAATLNYRKIGQEMSHYSSLFIQFCKLNPVASQHAFFFFGGCLAYTWRCMKFICLIVFKVIKRKTSVSLDLCGCILFYSEEMTPSMKFQIL